MELQYTYEIDGKFLVGYLDNYPEHPTQAFSVEELEENLKEEREQHRAYWHKIIEDIQNCDEVLEGEPEPIRFKTPEEIDAL